VLTLGFTLWNVTVFEASISSGCFMIWANSAPLEGETGLAGLRMNYFGGDLLEDYLLTTFKSFLLITMLWRSI
jgi:hypothetical protein